MNQSKFYKILLLDHKILSNVTDQMINSLENDGFQVYKAYNNEQINELVDRYIFDFYIIEINWLEKIEREIFEKSKIIILLQDYEYKTLQDYMKYNKDLNVVDYFFMPLDSKALNVRLSFFTEQEKEEESPVEENLHKFLWTALLQREQQLYQVIWKKNYDHYVLTKYSQYIVFFSDILGLLNNYFQNFVPEQLLLKFSNLISLQMCFFNSYIKFSSTGYFPKKYNSNFKYFLLYLIYLSECLKIQRVNCEIKIDFVKDNNIFYSYIELDRNLTHIIHEYNHMYKKTNHLFHFLQEYLWEHWQKKVTSQEKSDKVIVIEVFLYRDE